MNKKSVSKLIQLLEAKGLVKSEKRGKNRYNRITDEGRIAVTLMR